MTPTVEQWRPVPNRPGYEVSDHGRVRTLNRQVSRGVGRGTRLQRGVVLKARLHPEKNRYYVGVWMDSKMELRSVHSLVLEAFIGPRPDGAVACHNDGDSTNNQLGNLRWDSQSSNIRDSVKHGTHNRTSRTECPRGHRLVPPNLDVARLARGHRICLACKRAAGTRRYAIPAGRPFDFDDVARSHYAQIMGVADVAVHNSTDRQAS